MTSKLCRLPPFSTISGHFSPFPTTFHHIPHFYHGRKKQRTATGRNWWHLQTTFETLLDWINNDNKIKGWTYSFVVILMHKIMIIIIRSWIMASCLIVTGRSFSLPSRNSWFTNYVFAKFHSAVLKKFSCDQVILGCHIFQCMTPPPHKIGLSQCYVVVLRSQIWYHDSFDGCLILQAWGPCCHFW